MYGQTDIYNSPDSGIDDDFGFLGIGGSAPGVLGIAIGKKAKQKKWDFKLAKTMGKLKKLFEQEKFDKAQKRARKLTKIVSKLEGLGEYDAEENPEVVAWIDFSESGDVADLQTALGAVSWTGDETIEEEDEFSESGLVRSPGSGVRGGAHTGRRQRRRLPPGFRPGGYGMWRRARKVNWLSRHRNAASAPDPRDPGQGWGRGRNRGGGRAGRQGTRGSARAIRQAFRQGRTRGRGQGLRRGRGQGLRRGRGEGIRRGRRQGFRRGRGGRYGEVEDEFGGLIGIEAFPSVFNSGITRGLMVEEWDDGLDDDFEALNYGEDTTAGKIQSEGPQFGSVFKRKTEKRVESARRKYERLRDRAVTAEDWSKVEGAMRDYRKLAHAYKKAAVAPTPRTGAQALAGLTEQPLFRSSAQNVFLDEGGQLPTGVHARSAPMFSPLATEEMMSADVDLQPEWEDMMELDLWDEDESEVG